MISQEKSVAYTQVIKVYIYCICSLTADHWLSQICLPGVLAGFAALPVVPLRLGSILLSL